jgi:hypothetical protein
MINAWQALADDIMAFLIARGVRPTPHRYAVVSHLADHGILDEQSTDIYIGEGGANVNRTILRRAVEMLLREGIVEPDGNDAGMLYRLRPAEEWGDPLPGVEDTSGDQRWVAAD